jgi:hypothetical protein
VLTKDTYGRDEARDFASSMIFPKRVRHGSMFFYKTILSILTSKIVINV